MKNHILWAGLLFFLSVLSATAINYKVRFTGSGAGSEVTRVEVQNLNTGNVVNLTSGQELNLSDAISGNSGVDASTFGDIESFTDRSTGNTGIRFQVLKPGTTTIELFASDGKRLHSFSAGHLQAGMHSFKLSLPGGLSIVRVMGNGFIYHTKLICRGQSQPDISALAQFFDEPVYIQPARVSSSSLPVLQYTPGDRLLFQGYSGNMSTVVTGQIARDTTINFTFVPCVDADGNHYPTVTIGDQVWMAENLKTTKYADGTPILLRASKDEYMADPNRRTTAVYRYFNDDPKTKDLAGLAYKYQTIQHKNVCPEGWHVPSHYEWRKLRDALGSDNRIRFNSIRKTGNYWRKDGATNASGFSAVGTGAFWDEWYVHEKTWAIWLASDLFNASSTDNWFFYASTDENLTDASVICDEIASSSLDFITAVRCVKDNNNSYDVLRLGELPLGFWVTPPAEYQTNAEYKRIKEGGFNFVNGFHYSENVATRVQQVLNFSSNNGLKFLVNKAAVASDIIKYASTPDPGLITRFIEGVRPFANHPAYAGELLMDEPGKNLFNAVAAFTDAFSKAYPDKLAHVNLFPTYATGGIQAPNYANYIDSWLQTQQPRHLSFDSYPLLAGGGIINDYFYNLDLVRAKTKEKGIPFWTFIQTLSVKGTPGIPDKREPSETDIRWQVWSNLAFGAKGIQYFTYWTPGGGSEQFGDALIGLNGQPTIRYAQVKKLNADINRIGKILLHCHAEGVIQTTNQPFQLYAPRTSFENLTSVSGIHSLVGCFKSREDETKLLVTALLPDKNAEVTLRFATSVSVVRLWINNISETRTLQNNVLMLSILPGEAVLVEF